MKNLPVLGWASILNSACRHAGQCAVALFLSGLLVGSASAQTTVSISRAEWKSGDRELRVEGRAERRSTVAVANAGDGALLMTARADSDGRWKVEIRRPSPVPCRVRAAAGSASTEREVEDRPANCGPLADTVAPTAPSALTATAVGAGRIDLAWSPASDNVTVADYRIERCGGAACTNFGALATTGLTAYADTAVTAAASYRYRVRATDPAGNLGPYSNVAEATTGTTVGTPALSIDDVAVAEGGVARFTVTLSATPAQAVTVVVSSAPGTAVAPADFNALAPRTLLFAAGTSELAQTVAVTTVNDTLPEGSETFSVNLASPVNATLAKATGTATIAADDFTDAASAHATMNLYDGPQTCLRCHETEARQMHGSVHYQQNGVAPNVSNVNPPGTAFPTRAGEGPADRPLAASPLGTPVDSLIGINTYCGTHQNSPRFTCANCHVGNGRFPKTPAELAALDARGQVQELANIDCMTCHQQAYKRFPAWPEVGGLGYADLTLENVTLAADGRTLLSAPGASLTRRGLEGIPVVDPLTHDFEFRPAGAPGSVQFALPAGAPTAPMALTTEAAAQTVHRTTRQSCLNCHAGAGGGNGTKRGDLSTALADPPLALDMHMSQANGGARLSCSSCHNVEGAGGGTVHRVRGRGLDLRPNDVAERFNCDSAGCHSANPHDSGTLNRHTARVACQTCHIPTYAKVVNGVGAPTETMRDWQAPHLSQSACNGRGGWLPNEIKAQNLIPTYQWFNGTSRVSYVGEPLAGLPTKAVDGATAEALNIAPGTAAYVLGAPNGAVDDATAKIYPMKEHWGKLARDTGSDRIVPHSTFEFFRTGSFCRAVSLAMGGSPDVDCVAGQLADVPAPAEVVPVHTFQTLNHGVEVADNALGADSRCGNCHSDPGLNGGPPRMLFTGAGGLGYELREPATANGLCNNCHDAERNEGFVSLHNEHRGRRDVNCGSCHLKR